MSRSLVSIILPAYNAEAYIAEAIQSVLDQSYTHWELLLINDGSTDATERIIQQFTDFRIHYFEQENRGVSAARNVGLANMQGEFFCFLDADDVLPPKSLESRLTVFEQNPEVMFVDGQVEIRDVALQNTIARYTPNFKGNPHNALARLNKNCFFGPSWMIRHRTAINYRFSEGMTHAEDLYFYLSISESGQYDFTQETVLHYRKSNNSAMTNLKGLENGYAELLEKVQSIPTILESNKKYLRFRIMRIMFLSYLNQRQPLAAIRAAVRYATL